MAFLPYDILPMAFLPMAFLPHTFMDINTFIIQLIIFFNST